MPAEPSVPAADATVDEEATATVRRLMPFAATLGITMMAYRPDEVRARLPWRLELCTTGEVLHGGAVMSLADATGGACAYLNLPGDAAGTTTIESKTNFFRAARGPYVESVSRPLHVGRTLVAVETDVRDHEGRLVAKVTQSQLVLRPERT